MHHGHSHHRYSHHHGRRFARRGHSTDESPPEYRHHDRGGRSGVGRSGLGRFFAHGDLRLVILHLIAEKPRHGYEIIKAIEDLANGAYTPSPGVIYPTLTLLEELGQVAVTAEGNRKSYSITEPGRDSLAADQAAVNAILARIAEAQRREPAPPIIRAMENLKTALRLKLGAEDVPAETIRAVAAALDDAAKKIEES